jgi:hypothetical protein
MAPGYSISGIGYDPLGYLGLGLPGQYSSYYDSYMPSMMGFNPSVGMNYNSVYNPMFGYAGGGNSQYMVNMYDAMNTIEKNQVNHTGEMHRLTKETESNAIYNTDSADFSKMITDASVKDGIERLARVIESGNGNDICRKYDELKNAMITRYSDELAKFGSKINIDTVVRDIISDKYSEIVSKATGEQRNLYDNIKKYSEGAGENGFLQGYKPGHDNKYTEEVLCHIFGDEINDKKDKDTKQSLAKGAGYVGRYATAGVAGGTAATGLWAIIKGGQSLVKGQNKMPSFKKFGKIGAIAALLTTVGTVLYDTIWQNT